MHIFTLPALLFQTLNTLSSRKGFSLKHTVSHHQQSYFSSNVSIWNGLTPVALLFQPLSSRWAQQQISKHTFQHYSTSVSGIQHNFHQPQPHFFKLNNLTHTALLCRVSGLWPVTVLVHLFQVCKLLQVVLGDLVVHHHPDGKIPHNNFADHEQGLDDVNGSLHRKQQSISIEEEKEDEGQLKNHGQKPKACQLWHLRGRRRKCHIISFSQGCNRWTFNHKLSHTYACTAITTLNVCLLLTLDQN